MRNKLITLSGLDSAGKSTQIEKLESYFLSNNIKVKVIWSRGGYTPLFNVLKYILRIWKFQLQNSRKMDK